MIFQFQKGFFISFLGVMITTLVFCPLVEVNSFLVIILFIIGLFFIII